MTSIERYYKFSTAMDIVRDVYSDYCNDINITRGEAREFCDFVLEMADFMFILGKKADVEKG